MAWLVKKLVSAVNRSDENIDKTPEKEKKVKEKAAKEEKEKAAKEAKEKAKKVKEKKEKKVKEKEVKEVKEKKAKEEKEKKVEEKKAKEEKEKKVEEKKAKEEKEKKAKEEEEKEKKAKKEKKVEKEKEKEKKVKEEKEKVKKEKKKEVKEEKKKEDKPPSSSSSYKRRFQGLLHFFSRMRSFCGVSSSSEQNKMSSIQTQKTSDNNSSAVTRSTEKDQKAAPLTANQEKAAVQVAVDGSFSSADVRSSEQKIYKLLTAIQENEPVTVDEGTKPSFLRFDGPSTSGDRFFAQERIYGMHTASTSDYLDFECLLQMPASLGVQWHDLTEDSMLELIGSLLELEELSEEESTEEEDADQVALSLPNLGNTCYMNSVLQCLLSVSPFQEDLLSQQENYKDCATLLRVLTDLQMRRMDSSDFNLKETHLTKIKSYIEYHFPDFKGNNQQDAHEFLMACLSCLKEESNVLKSVHPDFTCPVSSMEFQLKSERTCNSCGLIKTYTEKSSCLSLVIGSHASLTDSLQQYLNASFIDIVCSLCGGLQSSEILKFLTLPRVLLLLVQRFDFTSSMIKLENRLEIPEELTLSCVKERTEQAESSENSTAGRRSLLQRIFRKKKRVALQTPQEEAPDIISTQYRLTGVVSHEGSLFSGHYISHIRDASEVGWLRCSDMSVRRCSWTEVSEDVGMNGYLLFYVKS